MNQTGKYSFYVHDYTNSYKNDSNAMATSGAQVKVYAGEELVATYHVPNQSGTLWHVFDFDVNTRKLIPVNAMSYQRFASDVGQASNISTFSLENKEDLKDYEKAATEPVSDETSTEPCLLYTSSTGSDGFYRRFP